MPARLLIIALDAADSNLLDRWSADGRLPNLTRLRQRGSVRFLETAYGATDDSLWASFEYGTSEAEHGRSFYKATLPSGEIFNLVDKEKDRDAFWHRLGAQGLRMGIFDVPKCPPPKAINGIHLTDWLVHGKYTANPLSYPPQLVDEIRERFGAPPPSRCGYHQKRLSDDDAREVVRNIRTSVTQKRAAALHYLATEPWDLFAVGFKEGHCAGHGLWNFFDPTHPEFDAARTARLGHPVEQILRDIDAAIGELIDAAGPDAEIVLFSTTAMEPNGSVEHLMPQIVQRMNAVLSGQKVPWLDAVYEWLQAELPMRAAWWLADIYRRFRRSREGAGRDSAGPLINLLASDSCGAFKFAPGVASDLAERARLQQQVWEMLDELVDARTGKPVLSWITYPSAAPGERSAQLPDMLAHYNTGLVPDAVRSPRLGYMRGHHRRRRPGNHMAGGFAIVAGAKSLPLASELSRLEDFAAFAGKVLEGGQIVGSKSKPREVIDATAEPVGA